MTRRIEILIPLMILLLAGCASVQVTKNINDQQLTTSADKPIAHLYGEIYGYYLFGLWPLITGDPNNEGSCRWFSDTVTDTAAVEMLTRKSKELGASKTTDLNSWSDSSGKMTLWIVWYYNAKVSGNAVK